MTLNLMFIFNSIVLGIALAMDAFSVSIANSLNEPKMNHLRMVFIAGTYAFFQFAMPLIGWLCVHTIIQIFTKLQDFIPWIAFLLLCYIGIKMLTESCKKEQKDESVGSLTFKVLLVQGIATSMDALSVGFAIAEYNLYMALLASAIISVVTYIICTIGLLIGKTIGKLFQKKAEVAGGIIIILIGIEILLKALLFS